MIITSGVGQGVDESIGGGGSANDLGWFVDEAALVSAHPVGTDGNHAIVGTTDTVWIWDGDTVAWVDSSLQGTGDMVGANNLSDLASNVTSRNNLDVYSKAEIDALTATIEQWVAFPASATAAGIKGQKAFDEATGTSAECYATNKWNFIVRATTYP